MTSFERMYFVRTDVSDSMSRSIPYSSTYDFDRYRPFSVIAFDGPSFLLEEWVPQVKI